MKVRTSQYRQIAAREMADAHTRRFLRLLPVRLAQRRKAAFADYVNPAAAMRAGAAIRAKSLENLPALLETFETNARASGAKVFWAQDADQANRYIIDTAKENGVSVVTKGKSMISEETGLNEALSEAGIETWETDLGEFITQLLERPPFHIVGPAINIPVERISEIFQEKGVIDSPESDPVRLGLSARRFLRNRFRAAGMGITGVNMAVAETGTLINVENEGNIRFCKSAPRIQVSVMSLEKVVETLSEALELLRLLCRSSTGQLMSAYVSMDCGPKKQDELDGPEQLHIVILDNGRSRIYQDPVTRNALQCIRCGACLNACPVYGQIGGYPYGWAYSGPMGQVVSPLLLGLSATRDLFKSCTLCGTCRDICPAGVDHPKLMLHYRSRDVEADPLLDGSGSSLPEKTMVSAYVKAASHPALWEAAGRGLRSALNLRAKHGVIESGPGVFKNWFQSRDLPEGPSRSFRSLWDDDPEEKGDDHDR